MTGTARATRVLAPNPSPMTLDGTNTWLLAEPGARRAVVVDPGPDDAGHFANILAHAEAADVTIELILLTHGHIDHAEGAGHLAELTKSPVRALDPALRLGSEGLTGGDVIDVDGLEIQVIATPGHSGDSLSFLLPADRAVLTGDTILGRGTTVVAHPDGKLADYLDSLHRLWKLADAREITTVLPGHGPVLDNALATLDYYIAHRAERLAQVEAALAAGDTTARQIVERVYADVDRAVWPFAEMSVRAQLEYLKNG